MFQIFKNIFKKEPKICISSLEDIGVDMHNHLIPNIDDGSKSMDETIVILKKIKELGYRKVITTPHIMAGAYNNNPEIILKGKKEVLKSILKEDIDLEFDATSEYYLDEHFERLIDSKDLLPFSDNYILFEQSFMAKPNSLEQVVFKLQTEGYKPILAHPERYNYLADKNLENLKKIKNSGVLFQLNLFSLIGTYGPVSLRIAEALINEKMIDFVGTDLHNAGQLIYFESLLKNKLLFDLIQQDTLLNNTL